MPESLIEIKCPACGHVWHENVEDLKKQERVFYKVTNPQPDVKTFRLSCPVCATYVLVDVVEEADDA